MLYPDFQTQKDDLAFARVLLKEPLLGREEEKALALSWRDQGDEKALHNLVRPYGRLVISIALRFRYYGLPMGDLIQEGNVGLMQAAKRFDPSREVRFSTYAKWWIRSCIQEFILRNWSIVRTGSTLAQKQLFFNLRRLRSYISSATDRMTSEDHQKIAESLNVTVQEVIDMENRLSANDLSLNSFKHQEGEESWLDKFVDTSQPSPEDLAFQEVDRQVQERCLEEALHHLSPRERIIIMARRLTDSPTTLEALGKTMKISKERIRQLESRALRKLRYCLMNSPQGRVVDLMKSYRL